MDPVSPSKEVAEQIQLSSSKKVRKNADAIHIPRANISVLMQYKLSQDGYGAAPQKALQQIPYSSNLAFVSTTGTLLDVESGHIHPTYLHSSGMHGHHCVHNHHSHQRKLSGDGGGLTGPVRIIDAKLAALFVDPQKMNIDDGVAPGTVENHMSGVDQDQEKNAKSRRRPQTAPVLKTPKLATATPDFFKHFQTITASRPQSAHVRILSAQSQDLGRLVSLQQNNSSFRKPIQAAPPVAPTIVRTQTVRSNLDSFSIEKVALRRLRFVVENNVADVEHLSLVDLVESGQVPGMILSEYFGQQYATPHDLRVLLLQSIDKSRRIRRRKQGPDPTNSKSTTPTPPSQHPIHDTHPPNKGLQAAYHHTHPHHASPATPICSYSTYTATSYTPPRLASSSVPASSGVIPTRGPIGETDSSAYGSGGGVPKQLEERHELQAMLMLTHTTSDAAANYVVTEDMREALGSEGRVVAGAGLVSKGARSSTAMTIKRLRGTSTPATCVAPNRPFTPAAMAIAKDATRGAIRGTEVRRVTTPNEVLDVLRRVEGSTTVLAGVVGVGWNGLRGGGTATGAGMGRNNGSRGARKSSIRSSTVSSVEDIVLEAMAWEDALYPTKRAPTTAADRRRPKKSNKLLAEEPPNGEPDDDLSRSLELEEFTTKHDIAKALNEQRMLRIIERRRAAYLGLSTG